MSVGAVLTDEERRDLIVKLSSDQFDSDEQLRTIALLTPEKRAVFDQRLAVLARYEVDTPHSVEKAAAAAAQLNMTPRNLGYLLTKMREMGPGVGLAPSLRIKKRASSKDGLASELDAAVLDFLKDHPDARISAVHAYLVSRFGQDVPSRPTVGRRVAELRSSPLLLFAASRIAIGEELVVDQCGVDLSTGGVYAITTFVIDKQSRLILGWAVTDNDGEGEGLGEAVKAAITYLLVLVPNNLALATSIKSIEWVVAPGLERQAKNFEQTAEKQGIDGQAILGVRRHGSRLRKLIGNRLGPFGFRSRTGPTAEKVVGPDLGQLTPLDIMENVHAEVDRHNQKIIDAFAASKAQDADDDRRVKASLQVAGITEVFSAVLPAYHDEMIETAEKF